MCCIIGVHSSVANENTIGKIERLIELFAYACDVCACICTILPFVYSNVNYFILDAGKESFFLPGPMWFPFDWKTPLGYLVAWIGEFVFTVAITKITVPFYAIIAESCWLFSLIAEDISADLATFNLLITLNSTGKAQKHKDRVCTALMALFCDVIQIYTNAKRCVTCFIHAFMPCKFIIIILVCPGVFPVLMKCVNIQYLRFSCGICCACPVCS